ncbi:winged helix-turn-helix domain-containing protein [Amycolatopsis pretoriensis]|uniref:winged helix-turn-helix domain-containing protein n=1 Tax=Amycolatopsis pretoriensis TaxID=218821 RepID=UPI00130217DE|nr:winged helix-turn-helix domain-containing protein [Amycolatopsis pretoriensis]
MPERIQVGGLDLHLDGYRVFASGESLVLSRKEFEILYSLARARGRVCSRKQLQAEVWGDGTHTGSRSLDFHIRSLRVKLGDPGAIVTVRSIGYKIGVAG